MSFHLQNIYNPHSHRGEVKSAGKYGSLLSYIKTTCPNIGSQCVAKVIGSICYFVRVHTVKEKQLEL